MHLHCAHWTRFKSVGLRESFKAHGPSSSDSVCRLLLLSQWRIARFGGGSFLDPNQVGVGRAGVPMRQNVAINRRHCARVGPWMAFTVTVSKSQDTATAMLAGW